MTCKETPCYMRDSAWKCHIVENTKRFSSYVKHFWNLPRTRNTESWLVYGYCQCLLYLECGRQVLDLLFIATYKNALSVTYKDDKLKDDEFY